MTLFMTCLKQSCNGRDVSWLLRGVSGENFRITELHKPLHNGISKLALVYVFVLRWDPVDEHFLQLAVLKYEYSSKSSIRLKSASVIRKRLAIQAPDRR